MSPFLNGPTVIPSFLDLVNHFPQVLADFAAPEIAGGPIKAEAPKLSQAVSVNLWPGAFGIHKGIIFGNAVTFIAGGVVHVDAERFGVNAGEVLADVEFVGNT